MDAWLEEMKACQKETTACQETKEFCLEKTEAYLERKEPMPVMMANTEAYPEVPNEEVKCKLPKHWRTDMGSGI
jgi:hypothetical protein